MVTCFNYYLITFDLKYMQGNIYVNTIVSAVIESIANLVSGIYFSRLGVVKSLFFSFILAGISIVGMIYS